MSLITTQLPENLLPRDGIVRYYGPVISKAPADHYLRRLLDNIAWRHDEAMIFGRHIITKRKVAWYGDEHYAYTYSNMTRQALPWTEELLSLRTNVAFHTGTCFNSCLLNLYHDGSEGMAWHSDDEKALGRDTTIASLSFGAERRFLLRHRQSGDTIELKLEHGSLLVMAGSTQTHWLHSIPKSTRVKEPRVNLTFRTMIRSEIGDGR